VICVLPYSVAMDHFSEVQIIAPRLIGSSSKIPSMGDKKEHSSFHQMLLSWFMPRGRLRKKQLQDQSTELLGGDCCLFIPIYSFLMYITVIQWYHMFQSYILLEVKLLVSKVPYFSGLVFFDCLIFSLTLKSKRVGSNKVVIKLF